MDLGGQRTGQLPAAQVRLPANLCIVGEYAALGAPVQREGGVVRVVDEQRGVTIAAGGCRMRRWFGAVAQRAQALQRFVFHLPGAGIQAGLHDVFHGVPRHRFVRDVVPTSTMRCMGTRPIR